jgi:hypothetical protein
VVFLGGAVVGLLVEDPGGEPPRATDDVDVIIDVTSYWAFSSALDKQLRDLGFATPMGGRIGRWTIEGVSVDIMPIDQAPLGFGNRWYRAAFESAGRYLFPDGTANRLVTAPCFLATKLEAFKSRGRGDYAASQDIEDFVAVIDNRRTLDEDIRAAAADVRTYLVGEVRKLLAEPAFEEALPGYLRGEPARQARLPELLASLRRIART